MLRGALVGVGNVGLEGHLPGWRRRADTAIVAVADARPERRAACEARLPGVRWYDSAETLMDVEPLDFVDVCTPPVSHASLVRAALARKLHVLCEKPLVGSLGDLESVLDDAAAAGRVLHTVHNWHHAPIVQRTHELVRAGAIGRVTRLVWQTLRTQPAAVAGGDGVNWRLDPAIAGGGVLSDHGWHVFYLLQRWAGVRPTSVRARLETRRHTRWDVEDTATVEIAFPGATAEILLTWAADARGNRAELHGTTGTIHLEDGTLVLARGSGEPVRTVCPPPLSDGSFHPDRFDAVADRFVAALTGAARDVTNVAEAAICVALEHAARESSRRGGDAVPVSLPPGVRRALEDLAR